MNAKRKGLGRGLESLLGDLPEEVSSYVSAVPDISIDDIEANPWQPRSDFEEEALKELAESIKQQGIIQPVTVRKLDNGKYQLISGERRLRAARMAGLTSIPAYVRQVDDVALLEMALVENIQRQDLNAIEIALSFKRLIEECNLTQEQLSEKVSKNRSTIANYLRLLKLPPEIQVALRDGVITMGHARALISIEDASIQMLIFNKVIQEDLSVRQVEELVRRESARSGKSQTLKSSHSLLPDEVKEWQQQFSQRYQTQVRIAIKQSGRGSITISFKNLQQLQQIMSYFKPQE